MSRATKESEDEIDMKIGRRTKATGGTSVVDSPLRRSTRNKQPVNHDDGSSPESIASDVTGPPTRSSRRKISTMEYSAADNTRSLRPRKNSTASDTTDFADGEAPRDINKRITRRSVATASSVETPTKVRLRRTTRAGSESNTASPAIRPTRRTRASSVDLDDNNDTLKDKSSLIHLHTPLKTRNRASALPSEPSVVEESDNLQKDIVDYSIDDDSRNSNVSGNHSAKSIRSPLLRLEHADETEVTDEMGEEETPIADPMNVSKKLRGDVSESPANNFSRSSKLRGKLISEIDLPKIVLYKADMPAQKSPRNKENEKSNIIMADQNLKTSNSFIVSQRKSANFPITRNIQVKQRLNRSIDDNLMTNIDHQSMSGFSSSSNNLSKTEQLETSINNRSLASTDIVSATIGSKNESIIFLGETNEINEHKKSMNDTVNDETIHMHPQLQEVSLKNVSQDPLMDSSVMEIDTTADNFADDGTASNDCNISVDVTSEVISPETAKDHENSDSIVANISQQLVENDIESSSPLLLSNIDKDIRTTECSINTLNASNNEASNTITSRHSIDNGRIHAESVVEATKDEDENGELTKYNEHRSSLNKHKSTPRRSQLEISLNKVDNDDDGNNVSGNENIETDVEDLFQDIPAEEWKLKRAEESVTNECNNAIGLEQDSTKYQNVAFAGKKSWEITQKSHVSKMVETSDYDSDDTVIMQTTNTLLKRPETAHCTIIVEEPMDVTEDDDDTEIDQENKSFVDKSRRKSLSKNRQSSAEISNENNDKNIKEKELERDASFLSKNKSSIRNDMTIHTIQSEDSGDIKKKSIVTKSTENAPRYSLNIKSHDSNNENKMRRRTIEKMNLAKCNVHKELITSETNQMDSDEDENVDEKKIECSIKSPTDSKQESLNESIREEEAIQNLIDEEETDGDHMQSSHGSSIRHKKYSEKSKKRTGNSASMKINSTSDSGSSDENNESTIMPEFLFNVNTSEEDSDDEEFASIDSDVGRELNLNGDSISNYSDDNVAGDECRASETETSNDEDEDDDDDMANFIVDDDEDVEEEDSSEKNESEDEESSIKLLLKDNESLESGLNESANESGVHSKKKIKPLESTTSSDEERVTKVNGSPDKMAKNTCYRNSPKNLINTISMDSSTPKIRKRMSEGKSATSPKVSTGGMQIADVNTSISNGAEMLGIPIRKSLGVVETLAQSPDDCKIQKTSANICSPKIQKRCENSKPSRSKSLSDAPINHSMQIAPIESPEMKLLMKEKLNASLPALQLEGRSSKTSRRSSLKASRRSSLMNVEEVPSERGEEPFGESMTERKDCNLLAENLEMEKSNAVSVIEDKNIGKKKNKKKLTHTENSTVVEKQAKQPKKKKDMKQKSESLTHKSAIVTNKSHEELLQRTLESKTQSLAIEEHKGSDHTTVTMRRTKKKISEDKRMKSEKTKPLKSSAINENSVPPRKPNIKRISEDILETITDVAERPKKRIKLDHKIIPSRTMFDSKIMPNNLSIDDVDYISVSASGGTSQFSVVNLKKFTAKRSKKSAAALTFRERILGRNMRQPISAYLMYQQKSKASGKNKH